MSNLEKTIFGKKKFSNLLEEIYSNKMATIIQRALNTGKESEDDFGLSDDEKKQLFTEIEKFNDKTPKKLQ